MVEVFKTNVHNRRTASLLLEQIHKMYADYSANFDLDDCDRILRVECTSGSVDAMPVICLLQQAGYEGVVLEDEVCSFH
jgi:hypothetical protein